MVLGIEEIRERVLRNEGRKAVNTALYHQARVKFHASTRLTPELRQPQADFFAFVDNLLPHDKAKVFKTLFRYPVATNKVVSVCFDKLARIFESRNPAFSYQFADTGLSADWESYRSEVLGEPDIWSSAGWNNYREEPNSVLVVDLPEAQEPGDPYPRPYFYWLPVSAVMAFEAAPSGEMRWLAFRQGGGRIAVIDGGSYRMFAERDCNVGELLSEHPHALGYCPARFFVTEPVDASFPDVKASPLTEELEALDWYLFYHTSKRHLDLYGSYPIYSGYEQACDFSNAENGDYCDGGYLKDKGGRYKLDMAGEPMPCPKCGQKRIIGAGSFVEVPVPSGDTPDLRDPVQMLAVDRGSLYYNVSELERLRTEIITSVVGTDEEITAREALNEQQVRANFESRETVLNRTKKLFEAAQKFVDDTVCRLRYGDGFVSSSINYGTDFFIYDADELRQRYKSAKEAGSSEGELDALHARIIETEYRSDPMKQRRMKMLADIEPFVHLTRSEAVSMHDKGLVTDEDLAVKLDFAGLVRRFERENTDILDFGSALDYSKRIDIIKQELRNYVSKDIGRKDGRRGNLGFDTR